MLNKRDPLCVLPAQGNYRAMDGVGHRIAPGTLLKGADSGAGREAQVQQAAAFDTGEGEGRHGGVCPYREFVKCGGH